MISISKFSKEKLIILHLILVANWLFRLFASLRIFLLSDNRPPRMRQNDQKNRGDDFEKPPQEQQFGSFG